MAVSPQVWYLVGIDLIGPYQATLEGYKFILTMTDYFSKYVETVPLVDKCAESVARGIYKVYCRHGAPVAIVTDQGSEFTNKVSHCKEYSIVLATVSMPLNCYMHCWLHGMPLPSLSSSTRRHISMFFSGNHYYS